MGEEIVEEGRGAKPGLFWWAVIICATTVVVAIGGPLIGRGTFIGTNLIRSELPWQAETPSDYQYRLPPLYDTVEIGAPARILIRDALVNDGRVALWDPFANGGTPLGSQPNTGIFAPLNWPLLLLGIRLGVAWSGLLRLGVAAAGTFFLLRRLGISRFAAVCGGLIYSTSGFLLSWNNWPQADLAAMLPLLFLTADRLRERRRAIDVAFLAVVVAAMLLEGYPPLLIAAFYLLGGFLVVRWWESSRGDARAGPSIAARLRSAIRPVWLLVSAVALGAALAAFQLVPFLVRLGLYDTSYRSANQGRKLPASALLTSVFPWAHGSPAESGTSIPVNYVTNFSITEQFVFLGAAAVVFVVLALLAGPPNRVGRAVYGYFVAVAAVLVLVLFGASLGPIPNVGSWLRRALYALPGMDQVPPLRLVAPLLFVATLLAAFGIELVVRPARAIFMLNRWMAIRAAAVLGFAGYMVVLAVRSEIDLTVPTVETLSFGVTREVAQREFILESAIVPALIGLATIIVIVVAIRGRSWLRRVAIGAIPVLLAVEGLLVTSTMLPHVDNRDFYPTTGSIRYLQRHLDGERVAPAQRMLYFGTNGVYGLRSVGGHSFTTPEWRDLVNEAGKLPNPATQLRLADFDVQVAQSPVLDRLGARYFVGAPYSVFGTREAAPPAAGEVVVSNDATATGTVPPGPLRGVALSVLGRNRLRGDLAFLVVTVRDPSGEVVARGRRRLITQAADTEYVVPIAGEDLPADTPWTVEVGLRSDRTDGATLAATATGDVSLAPIRPAEDGLELVYAEPGAVVYRRLTALPRIRWASRTRTVTSADARRKLLTTSGVDEDTVILSRAGPAASGQPAEVVVTEDTGDLIRAEIDAPGAGYLVIADAIQDDWSASVDGRPVELRDADHALVAIPVPPGKHTIEVTATPRGWRTGIVVSLIAVLVLVVLLAWGLMHRRRERRDAPVSSPSVHDGDDDHVSTSLVSK